MNGCRILQLARQLRKRSQKPRKRSNFGGGVTEIQLAAVARSTWDVKGAKDEVALGGLDRRASVDGREARQGRAATLQ